MRIVLKYLIAACWIAGFFQFSPAQPFSPWNIGASGCQVFLPMEQVAEDSFYLFVADQGDRFYSHYFSADAWEGYLDLIHQTESMAEWTEGERESMIIVFLDVEMNTQNSELSKPYTRYAALEKKYPGSRVYRGRWKDELDNIYIVQAISQNEFVLIQYMMYNLTIPEPTQEIQAAYFETPVFPR